MLEDLERLQCVALRDLHPSWLPETDAALVLQARHTPSGRRCLAQQLSSTQVLFRMPARQQIDCDVPAASYPWWLHCLNAQQSLWILLGAHVYLPLIRASISRQRVLQWLRVLGESDYGALLRTPAERYGERAIHTQDELPEEDERLRQSLLRTGYQQLVNYADTVHGCIANRVLLAFPANWNMAVKVQPIAGNVVAALLMGLHEDGPLEGEFP